MHNYHYYEHANHFFVDYFAFGLMDTNCWQCVIVIWLAARPSERCKSYAIDYNCFNPKIASMSYICIYGSSAGRMKTSSAFLAVFSPLKFEPWTNEWQLGIIFRWNYRLQWNCNKRLQIPLKQTEKWQIGTQQNTDNNKLCAMQNNSLLHRVYV